MAGFVTGMGKSALKGSAGLQRVAPCPAGICEGVFSMARESRQKATPAEVEKYLKGLDYPAERDELVDWATEEGAPDNVISLLERIPDREYESPADVAKGIGEVE